MRLLNTIAQTTCNNLEKFRDLILKRRRENEKIKYRNFLEIPETP
jgi:hypothetical protein